MSNRTTRGFSLTLPITVCEKLDAHLDRGFGVPKGSYSALFNMLATEWLEKMTSEAVSPLNVALEKTNESTD